ncbi:MAG: DUF5663 domain-containing protein [Patescibacteria group bacterium]
MESDALDIFVDQLLKDAKLENLPADYRDQYIVRLKEQIEKRLGIIIMQNLDEASLDEFTQLIQHEPKPNLAKIQSLFSSRIPDFDQKIKDGMVEFASQFIASAQK